MLLRICICCVNVYTSHPKNLDSNIRIQSCSAFCERFCLHICFQIFFYQKEKNLPKNLGNIILWRHSVRFVFEKNFVSMLLATFLLLQKQSKSGLLSEFCVNYSECENFVTSFKEKESLFHKWKRMERLYSKPDRGGFDLYFL